jgi:hypothetical protein
MTETPQAARRYLARIGRKGGAVKGKRNATETGKQAAAKRWALQRRIEEMIKAGDVLSNGYGVARPDENVAWAKAGWEKAKEGNAYAVADAMLKAREAKP